MISTRICARSIKAGCAAHPGAGVPADERWDAVRDRLSRAAAASALESEDRDATGRMASAAVVPRRRPLRLTRAARIDPFQPEQIRRLVREFGSPLLILDCARVRAQYRKLRRALPGVDLHYALKPMPHRGRGARDRRGGRLARSRHERRGAARAAPRGDPPRAASIRTPSSASAISATRSQFGVRTFVADNLDEVRKFKRYGEQRRSCCCGCRFAAPGRCATCRASSAATRRTRCRWRAWRPELGVDVRGLSFHVGSQAPDAPSTSRRSQACARLLARARRERLGGARYARHRRRLSDRLCAAGAGHQPLLRADARGAREAPAARAGDRRARPLHRRPRRDRRRFGDGARAARGSLVVLPR